MTALALQTKISFFFSLSVCATCKFSVIPGAAAGGWILGRCWAGVSPSGLSTAARGTKDQPMSFATFQLQVLRNSLKGGCG